MNKEPVNAVLVAALNDYLSRRHALGFQLIEEERHTRRFLEWLWACGNTRAAFTAARRPRGRGEPAASKAHTRASA
ncbi:hypothetical protein [Arthrobacter sp. H20]|uniref:hypothetical protein n=1 Tax=Arthrobacter sp. H20 TaxID=1267981 RepID=UPI0004B0994D|nr:hypothetical protein [Arthrobacter sp. H20]